MAKKVKTIKVARLWGDSQWIVRFGKLNPGLGRPEPVQSLFRVVGEKLPFDSISAVNKHLRSLGISRNEVYVAHDSMGYARYIGRGRIFPRLRARRRAQTLELRYFSFYVVEEKKHEREIETLLHPCGRSDAAIQYEEKKAHHKRGKSSRLRTRNAVL